MWKIIHPEEDKTTEPNWELRSRGQTAHKTARKAVAVEKAWMAGEGWEPFQEADLPRLRCHVETWGRVSECVVLLEEEYSRKGDIESSALSQKLLQCA